MPADLNPRTVREKLVPFVGKKVTVGTSDWHYISGKVESIEGETMTMSVAGKRLQVPIVTVVTIAEAPAQQAEYFK